MRTAAYVLGLVLFFGALIITGTLLISGEPFDPVVPCTALAIGAGIFGFGWLSRFIPVSVSQCAPEKQTESFDALEIDD